ncbi:uncharacterized protein BCR38DRAFT_52943 [Pseudomassariella vexata]|uniref:Uncharacterized protein n=1 Tax=Pseudomassariella vexata TaxID=1141098 RepID=A0A1Y2DL99_9PEZI|nr:uncharacterized protein BCR38DRAFT_52943 [Pseudomassariella vexata]ORY60050.1 hypothetical protein BCR38DRAFT_52943 [Pseudomassariella vexata]
MRGAMSWHLLFSLLCNQNDGPEAHARLVDHGWHQNLVVGYCTSAAASPEVIAQSHAGQVAAHLFRLHGKGEGNCSQLSFMPSY